MLVADGLVREEEVEEVVVEKEVRIRFCRGEGCESGREGSSRRMER